MSSPADPILADLEYAFAPGRFIPDQSCLQFIRDLEAAMRPTASILSSDPNQAASLYETILAGCYCKAEELDDSSGAFSAFIKQVVILWIEARHQAGADSTLTAATVLHWMDVDPFGFCSGLEVELCTALNAPALLAFESLVRARYEADPHQRESLSFLLHIYFQQKRTDAYECLAQQSGYPSDDCLALARLHAETNLALALHWVDRGLSSPAVANSCSAARYELPLLRRQLLATLGRGEEALASAWDDFACRPSKYTLDELLRYTDPAQRAEWREKALQHATGDLPSMMQLFIDTSESRRLARLIEPVSDQTLEDLSHTITKPAATILQQPDPLLAARLWRAQALRILNADKSKYYQAAVDNLQRARDCFRQAGHFAEWEKTALQISRAHSRKQAFIREFASVVSGNQITRLSFLDAARIKWQNQNQR